MQLWSGTLSPFSAKVRIVLAEKGLPYELHDVAWTRSSLWGEKPDDFLALSPRGQVPVLIDGELVIPDSTVICDYLEERYPDVPLMPSDPEGRARCRVLEDQSDFALTEFVTVLIREVFRKPNTSDRDSDAVSYAEEGIRGACRRHRYAHDGEFFFIPGLRALAGDAPTALDDDDECKGQRGL